MYIHTGNTASKPKSRRQRLKDEDPTEHPDIVQAERDQNATELAKLLNELIKDGKLTALPLNFFDQAACWRFAYELYFTFSEDDLLYACRGIHRVICIFCGQFISSTVFNFNKHLSIHEQQVRELGRFEAWKAYAESQGITLKKFLDADWSPNIDYDAISESDREECIQCRSEMERVNSSKKGQGKERKWKLSKASTITKKKHLEIKKKLGGLPHQAHKLKDFEGAHHPNLRKTFNRWIVKFRCATNLPALTIEQEEIFRQFGEVCSICRYILYIVSLYIIRYSNLVIFCIIVLYSIWSSKW